MKKTGSRVFAGVLFTLLFFTALVIGSAALFNSIDSLSMQAETETLRKAIRSAALTCYAVEGAYPDNIDYLRRHYGLTWDEDAYIVVYDAFASNIMPDLLILEKGGTQP